MCIEITTSMLKNKYFRSEISIFSIYRYVAAEERRLSRYPQKDSLTEHKSEPYFALGNMILLKSKPPWNSFLLKSAYYYYLSFFFFSYFVELSSIWTDWKLFHCNFLRLIFQMKAWVFSQIKNMYSKSTYFCEP